MTKYSEEQLQSLREQAYVSHPQILEAFNKLVELVKEFAATEHDRFKHPKKNNGDTYLDESGNERPYHHMSRRRGSRSGPKSGPRNKTGETIKFDDEGWATLTKPRKSFNAEEAAEEKAKFNETVKDNGMKPKPNNKGLGNSKAVDPREVIVDKQNNTFNAFEALGDEEETNVEEDNM